MTLEVVIAGGSTTRLTDSARQDYEYLLSLLEEDGIEGRIAEREPGGAGVTWIEVTEIWVTTKLLDLGADRMFGAGIDTAIGIVTRRVRQWIQTRRKETQGEQRPQSVIIKSPAGDPVVKIDMGTEGKITVYRWVKIDESDEE
jgi:hypothetical protein